MLQRINSRACIPILRELVPEVLDQLDQVAARYLDQPSRAKVFAECAIAAAHGEWDKFGLPKATMEVTLLALKRHGWDGGEVFPVPPRHDNETFLKHVNDTAFLVQDSDDPPGPPKQTKRLKGLLSKLSKLDSFQLETLRMVLEGTMALAGGFAVRRDPTGWTVRGITEGSEEHIVGTDLSHCTCGDSKYRGKDCKHIRALRKLL